MLKCFISLALTAFVLQGQSSEDLVRRSAAFYRGLDSFDIKGSASADIPGTSWRVFVAVETAAAAPSLLPSAMHASEKQGATNFSNFRPSRVNSTSTDPFPNRSIVMPILPGFSDLDRRLLHAGRVGAETLNYQGRKLACEIVDATYDESPEFKPHSQYSHARLWINPETLWVLKEAVPDSGVREWTFVVESMTFHQPAPETLVKALQGFATQSKVRPEWVGREIPDLTLGDLAGNRVSLSSLRGKPLLLDFWASYCGPCKAATALTEKLAEDYRGAGLQVWTITQDTTDDAQAWLAFNHYSLPTLVDPNGVAFKAFEMQGVPQTILIDSNGRVVKYWSGTNEEADMRAAIDELMSRTK